VGVSADGSPTRVRPSAEDRKYPPTSLHTEVLFESLDGGNEKQIRDLVMHDSADLNAHDWMHNGGRTPMHRAVENGDPRFMALLVELGGSVNVPDGKGRSPLHYACRIGNEAVLRVILGAPDVDLGMGSHVRGVGRGGV
jgi:ankyrin repeat protein